MIWLGWMGPSRIYLEIGGPLPSFMTSEISEPQQRVGESEHDPVFMRQDILLMMRPSTRYIQVGGKRFSSIQTSFSFPFS